MAVDLTTGSYDESGVFNKHNEAPKSAAKSCIEDDMGHLKTFETVKVLKECLSKKSIVVEGRFVGDDRPAIIVLEKTPFDVRDISQLFTADSRLELKFWNNIYGNYHVYPQTGFNGINLTVIHPATESDFLKFVEVPLVMVTETNNLYESAVLPYFKAISEKNSDCTNNSSDENKTIYRDSGDNTFVLLKDDLEKCLCTSTHFRAKAVILQKDLLSLRCLSATNIPFLIKLQNKCLEELSSKYEVPVSKIECYITYPPASFPLHIFFETVEKDFSIPVEKAHSLQTVISNLQLIPDYYQRIALTYTLPESDPLWKRLNEQKNNSAGKE